MKKVNEIDINTTRARSVNGPSLSIGIPLLMEAIFSHIVANYSISLFNLSDEALGGIESFAVVLYITS